MVINNSGPIMMLPKNFVLFKVLCEPMFESRCPSDSRACDYGCTIDKIYYTSVYLFQNRQNLLYVSILVSEMIYDNHYSLL